jgi:hypothetical protein
VKKTGTWFTLIFLVATVVVIFTALVVQTTRGPTFRAADYADMNECVENIPGEWLPGSLEYDGAETSCYYIHIRNRP